MKVLKPTTIPFPNNGQFIRNSTATYIEDGILKTAAINEPRWQDGKLLVEGEATNLLVYSSYFSAAQWGKSATVLPNVGTAPDGSETADLLTDDSPLSPLDVSCGVNVGAGVHVFSVWLRSPVSATARIAVRDGDGAVTSADCNVTDSWKRFSVSTLNQNSSSGDGAVWIYVRAVAGDIGDVYAWGAQLEGGGLTSYIPTTTAPATRQADNCIGNFSRASTATYIDNNGVLQTAGVNVPRIQNGKLLVEGEATNLQPYSQDLSSGAYSNCNRGPSSDFYAGSVPFWFVSKIYSSPYEFLKGTGVSVADGQEVEASCAFLAGNSSVCEVVLYGHGGTQRGPTSDASLEVISGPGYFGGQLGSGGDLVNLSATIPTLVRIRRVQRGADSNVSIICYPGGVLNTIIGTSVQATRFQLHVGESSFSYIPTTATPVTRAADIHTSGLVYTNATDSRPLWSSAVTHSVGQVIRYNNTVYESLQAANLDKQPDTNPTWWLSLGADNISAAFDGKVGSKTTAADKLRMIVYPGTQVDAVGYLETNAVVVNTSAVDTYGNIAYSNSTGFTESNIESWYDYFFVSPLADPATQVVHQGIPSLDPGLFIGIEMINPGTVEVGSVLTGYSTTIGKTQYGVKAGIVDYSKKESDEFGNVSIVERPYSKRMQGDVYVSNFDLNKVQRFLYNIRATPVLWMASDNPELAEVSYVYGFYKDFSTTISYPDVSMCNLDIEGLV